jgi:NOL1/NOP2/fmu family ribosome biogenesis protein
MHGPSVMPSVLTVGNSVEISADRQVACMRGPSVYVQTDTCQACVRHAVGNSVGRRVGKSVGECGKIP